MNRHDPLPRLPPVRRAGLRLAASLGLTLAGIAGLLGAPAVFAGTITVTSTTGTGAPTGAPPSAWSAPAMTKPLTITLGEDQRDLVLDRKRDYVLRCPHGQRRLSGRLSVWGGRNVMFADCHERVARPDWAAYFADQAGTLWIDGVHFGGVHLTGGIQLQEPGATVVMRDVLIDTVHGSYLTNHAELIQSWAGPRRLLIDGLTGSSTYQGLFLLPNQQYDGPPPELFDLRHIDIDDTRGRYALWLSDQRGRFPTDVQDVFVQPNRARTWRGSWLWGFGGADAHRGRGDTWANVSAGRPPGGHYVHATPEGAAGIDPAVVPPLAPDDSAHPIPTGA